MCINYSDNNYLRLISKQQGNDEYYILITPVCNKITFPIKAHSIHNYVYTIIIAV